MKGRTGYAFDAFCIKTALMVKVKGTLDNKGTQVGTVYRTFEGNTETVKTYNMSGELVSTIVKTSGNMVETYNNQAYTHVEATYAPTQVNSGNSGAQSNGGNLADGFGQLMNAGGVAYGGAEMGLQMIRQNNGAQVIGRAMGYGTQQTAQALKGTLGVVSKVGKGLGVAGYGLQVAVTGVKLLNGQSVGTAEAVGLGVSTALIGAGAILAGTAAAPFVAAGALIYGAAQLGSYMFTGQTVEEHIFGK